MERRLAEIHILSAIDCALRLFSTSSSIIPEEFKDKISDQIITDLSEFALHARRVNELCGFQNTDFQGADADRFNASGHDAPIETSYQSALNRLIHARKFTVGYSIWDGNKIFLESKNNIIPSYVKIETDRRAPACVKIFGVSFCFLTEVIQKIKSDFPDLQF